MQRTHHILRLPIMLLAGIALIIGGSLAGAAPVAAQAGDAPESAVQPDVGPPGTRFAFYATGFNEEENVSVWLNRPDGTVTDDNIVGVNEATPTGRVDWFWDAPLNAAPGYWSMVVNGNESNLEYAIPFEVRAGPPSEPIVDPGDQQSNVAPAAGVPGTRFAFFATGFEGGETVDVWLNTPGAQVIDADVEDLNEANETGRADWFWRAPEDAQPGTWSMVARGRDSGVEVVIIFDILPR